MDQAKLHDKVVEEGPPPNSEAFELTLPPDLLEKGWTLEWSDTDNRPYFYNHNTRVSIWEVPPTQYVSSREDKGQEKKSSTAGTRDRVEHVEAEPGVRADGKENHCISLIFLFIRKNESHNVYSFQITEAPQAEQRDNPEGK